jgi:uncharacterized protein YukE
MPDKLKVNAPEFEALIGSIEKKIEEIKNLFDGVNTEMSNLDGTHKTIWYGRAQEILYTHYKSVANKFPDIEKRLDEYVVFLKNTLDLYNQEEDAQEKSVSNQENNLDVM